MGFTSDACWFFLIKTLLTKNNKKREAALKNEAGGDEKHVFFLFFFTWPYYNWHARKKCGNIFPHFTHFGAWLALGEEWILCNIPEGAVGRWVLSFLRVKYPSPGAPSSAPFLNCLAVEPSLDQLHFSRLLRLLGPSRRLKFRLRPAQAYGHHFSRLMYKFYGAWLLCVASWRCFSGFMV